MRYSSFLVIPIVVCWASNTNAACVLSDYSVRSEFDRSFDIVVGTVVGERSIPKLNGRDEGVIYTVKLQDSFRGCVLPTFELFSENSSGRFPMTKGMKYFLFIYDDGDILAVDSCGNSGLLTERQKELGAVRDLVRSK